MNRAALRAQLHAAVDALVDALPVVDVETPAESKPARRRKLVPDPPAIPPVDDVTAARARAILRRRGLPVKESA